MTEPELLNWDCITKSRQDEKVLLRQTKKESLIDRHFAYNGLIHLYYRNRENPESLQRCIEVCKADIKLFPELINAFYEEEIKRLRNLSSFDKEYKLKYQQALQDPESFCVIPRIPSFQQLAIIYEKQGLYDEAIEICELAVSYGLCDGTQNGFEGRIDKIKKKTTSKPKSSTVPQKATSNDEIDYSKLPTEILKSFPDWHVSLSFSKSSSPNFPQAVELAKMAPTFLEHVHEGQILYQAVYSDKPRDYLQFIKLYELVSSWKGHFVIINGEVVDRKIISGLNYCYGDKCRSSNRDFCYGASYMTENPFGCHRTQISRYNNPWWSFGKLDANRKRWLIDKKAILKRITEYSEPYRLCPSFSWEKAISALEKLPESLSLEEKQELSDPDPSLVQEFKISITEPQKERKNRA